MTTLRVLATALPDPAQPLSWALFDAEGSTEASGTDRLDAMPAADRLEIVIGAAQARIARLTLPPLAPGRVEGAVAFAVEDQLAGPGDAQHLAASAQAADGSVRVVIVARDLIAAWSAIAVRGRTAARIVAEPDLLPLDNTTRWCARDAAGPGGFLRLHDGRALPVGTVGADGSLPAEIALALRTAPVAGEARVKVRVDAPVTEASLARWTKESGTTFNRGEPWRWEEAGARAFASALELLPRGAAAPTPDRRALRKLFVPAIAIASAAVVLHVVLTAGEWAMQKYSAWQRAGEWGAVAAAAGIAPAQAGTPASAAASIARAYAASKHAHGQTSPDDALPLLARSAAALAALPPGAVRSATYADGHWTFDLGRLDPAEARRLDAAMRASGTPALVATSAAGTRMRVGTP